MNHDSIMLCLILFILSTGSCAHHRNTEQRLSRIEAKQDAILQTLRIIQVRIPEEFK